jgi:hypothetical protein
VSRSAPNFSLLTFRLSRSTNLNAPPRFEPAAKASHDLGGECHFCQAVDRTLARNHRGQSGLFHLSGGSRALSEIPVEQFKRAVASSSLMATPSSPPKPCIARCDVDLRGNGWRGATIMSLGSQEFRRPLTNSSRGIVVSDQPLLDSSGAKMCGRRLIFGRGAGFSACLASSISSHSFRFGSKSMGLLAATECRQ